MSKLPAPPSPGRFETSIFTSGQMLDGIAVLPTVESAHGDLAVGVGKRAADGNHGLEQGHRENPPWQRGPADAFSPAAFRQRS